MRESTDRTEADRQSSEINDHLRECWVLLTVCCVVDPENEISSFQDPGYSYLMH